jgi:hypothetical protein
MRNSLSVSLVLCLALGANQAARADDQADMKALLAKALKAAGGEKNLAKYKALTYKSKGKFYGMGQEIDFTSETALQFPSQLKTTITGEVMGNTFTFVIVFNKDKGWRKANDTTEAMTRDQVAEQKEAMYGYGVTGLLALKDKKFKLSPVGETKVGKRDAVGVKVTSKGHGPINLYFDKKTHLLLKSVSTVKDMQSDKEVEQEVYYDKYKDFEGVKRATKVQIKRDGKKFVDIDETTDLKWEEKLDDSEFDKP